MLITVWCLLPFPGLFSWIREKVCLLQHLLFLWIQYVVLSLLHAVIFQVWRFNRSRNLQTNSVTSIYALVKILLESFYPFSLHCTAWWSIPHFPFPALQDTDESTRLFLFQSLFKNCCLIQFVGCLESLCVPQLLHCVTDEFFSLSASLHCSLFYRYLSLLPNTFPLSRCPALHVFQVLNYPLG